jgi:hypothetical protein
MMMVVDEDSTSPVIPTSFHILSSTLANYYTYFAAEAQSGEVICSRSHSW